MARRSRFPLVLSVLVAACVFEPLSSSDKRCPCYEGWICDTARDRCVRSLADAASDAGARDGGEGGALDASLDIDGSGIDGGAPVDSGAIDTGVAIDAPSAIDTGPPPTDAEPAIDARPECALCSCDPSPVFVTSFDEGSTSAFTTSGGCTISGSGVFEVSGGVAHIAASPAAVDDAFGASCFRSMLVGGTSGRLILEDLRFASAPSIAPSNAPIADLRVAGTPLLVQLLVTSARTFQIRTYTGTSTIYGTATGTRTIVAGTSYDVEVSFSTDIADDGTSAGMAELRVDGALDAAIRDLPPPDTVGCMTYVTLGTSQRGWSGSIDMTIGAMTILRGS